MQMIEISKLKPHPRNNEFFDDITGDNWSEFVKSISSSGVIESVVITQDYLIVSGHQRVRASLELGKESVPCEIRIYDTEEQVIKDLLETNLRQRGIGNTNPIKFARCIIELEKIYGIKRGNNQTSLQDNLASKTQSDLADQFGISKQQLQDYKKLLSLIPELQDLVEKDVLSPTIAYKVYSKLPKEQQSQLIEELGKDKIAEMTQKQTEEYLKENKMLQIRNETLTKRLDRRCNKEEKEVETVTKEFNTKIEDMESEKTRLQAKLFLAQEQLKTKTIEYQDNPDNLIQIESLKKQIKEKEEYVQKYKDTLTELNEKNKLVSKFMGESTSFELISTTSEKTLEIMNFTKNMDKYESLAEVFNEIPDASRREWVRSIYALYKRTRNILNVVKHDDVIELNRDIIDINNYVDIEEV